MNAPDRSFILRHKTLDLSQQRQSYDRFKKESRGAPPWTGSTPPAALIVVRNAMVGYKAGAITVGCIKKMSKS